MSALALELEKVTQSHCARLLAFEKENADFFSAHVPRRPKQMFEPAGMADAIAALDLEMKAGAGSYFVCLAEREIVGRINFTLKNQMAELGYRVGQKWTGQGVAHQMVDLGLSVVRREHLITKFYARALTENLASTRVLARAGFEQVSVEKDGGLKRGFSGDMVAFQLQLF